MALLTRSRRRLQSSAPFLIVILAGAGAAFFIIPLLGLLLRTPWTSAWQQLGSAEVLAALRLSLLASVSATAIALVLGVPLAWTFARLAFPGRSVLRALTVLPMVLPPVVGGAALLLALESNPDAAIVLSLVLLAVSLAVLIGLRDRWLGAS